ncbi:MULTISPECIES: HNH endonuclease signature motif containing protein [unclassified Sulfitobacter]|uniref:HNH endonuclease signature motif containing protein n=2 Tax=Sulfitobacter TaxID=60136 RepID=UPI0009EEE2CA|nr:MULTISPECIES: HNH endonuclease [unclassified Sulfitobacter]
MALRKMCVTAGCDDLAIAGLSHCEDHEARRLAKLAARRDAAGKSAHAIAFAALYRLAAWKSGRLRHLRRNPLCVDCAELGAVVEAKEVDHIIPHRGDRKLFLSRSNWQSLCKSCHSRKTAGEVFHGKGG